MNRYIEAREKVKQKRKMYDLDTEDLLNRWKSSVHREVEKARDFVVRFPSSMTAHARLADCLIIADEPEEAIAVAVGVLRMGVARLRGEISQKPDVPALYVALQSLLKCNRVALARQYLQDLQQLPLLATVFAIVLIEDGSSDEAFTVLARPDVRQVIESIENEIIFNTAQELNIPEGMIREFWVSALQ